MPELKPGTKLRITNSNSRFYMEIGTIIREGRAGGYWLRFIGEPEEIYVPWGYTTHLSIAAPRFSKKTMSEYIDRRRMELKTEFGFDPNNGSAQCDGKSDDFKIAYGHYEALSDLRDAFSI